MELAEQLEEQGCSEETVLEKVSLFRSQLLSKEVGLAFKGLKFISWFRVYLVGLSLHQKSILFPLILPFVHSLLNPTFSSFRVP